MLLFPTTLKNLEVIVWPFEEESEIIFDMLIGQPDIFNILEKNYLTPILLHTNLRQWNPSKLVKCKRKSKYVL